MVFWLTTNMCFDIYIFFQLTVSLTSLNPPSPPVSLFTLPPSFPPHGALGFTPFLVCTSTPIENPPSSGPLWSLAPSCAPPQNTHFMQTRSKEFVNQNYPFLSLSPPLPIPLQLNPSLWLNRHSHWKQAIADEFYALVANKTWSSVPCSCQMAVSG